jgi:hypothetical protein
MVFQAITGAQTPACLCAASDPVETVTPPFQAPVEEGKLLTAVSIISLVDRGPGAGADDLKGDGGVMRAKEVRG